MAPLRVPMLHRLRLIRDGKRDANKYMALQDYTRTHAIMKLIAFCHRGQEDVRQWLISKVGPIRIGNSQIRSRIIGIERRMERAEGWATRGGRDMRNKNIRLAQLDTERTAEEAQLEANKALTANHYAEAAGGLDSWFDLYQQAASIYERARASRIRSGSAASSATVPEFESLLLPDFSDFDQDEREFDTDQFKALREPNVAEHMAKPKRDADDSKVQTN